MKTGIDAARDHWERRAVESRRDADAVDSSRRSQRWRFKMFRRSQALQDARVLDVGCGLGDLFAYLREHVPTATYRGVDLSEAMIARCTTRFPGGDFVVQDLLNSEPEGTWDHVVAFGVHNVKLPGAEALFPTLLRRQFELCRVSAHVSLLTDRFAGLGEHALAWNPVDVLELALKITPHVTVRHDYLPHDFSVTLFRQPLADREEPFR